jgi:phosphonate metabolism-associated iron-containing alcohol dehydrogenase
MQKGYFMPTEVLFGRGTIDLLPSLLPIQKAQSIALFVGGSSLKKNGELDRILNMLKGKNVRVIDHVPPEPPPSFLLEQVELMKKDPVDCVLAVGGGSVMDLAKSVALLAMQKEDPITLLTSPPATFAKAIPTVCVPTTSGTGSEVTPFAVFWDHTKKKKYSIGHAALYATHALVDPDFTLTMPPYVTATTGMDAFTQACEAYWNKNANPQSDIYALKAISIILSALPTAVKDGLNIKARNDMALGSVTGGLAFSNTRTTACHSISYPMSLHFGVTHGQAVGITLPEVIALNASVQSERSAAFCEALDVQSIEEASDVIRILMQKSGLKTRLSELGIKKEAIEIIVKEGFAPGRMENTPYTFTEDALRSLLLRIL